MKQVVFFFFLCGLMMNCTMNHQNSGFTTKQIESLRLDSAVVLQSSKQTVEKIDLNPFLGEREFDFESLVKSLRMISLETTDESLLSNVYKIIVTDSYIYVYDDFKGGGIVIFTHVGKFVKRIPHGGGPGELYKLYDIAYDKENDMLVAYQHPYLLFYTSAGEFVEQKKVPLGFYNFTVTPNGYIFKSLDSFGNEHLGDLRDNTLLITGKDFSLKYAGLPTLHHEANYGGYTYLYNNKGNIQITQNYEDTIYHYNVSEHRLQAAYVMDYESKKLPSEYLEYSGRKLHNELSQNDYYYFIGEYLENFTHQVFFLRNDYKGLRSIVYRDKRTGKSFGGAEALLDLQEIPPIAFPKSVYGDEFISLYYPDKQVSTLSKSSMVSTPDKALVTRWKEEDNPILVLFKLKDF